MAERFGRHVDIAIMDVNLARGSNGVETAAILRRRRYIPSLFVRGKLDQKMQAFALEWKPVGFVGKPCSERKVPAVAHSVATAAA